MHVWMYVYVSIYMWYVWMDAMCATYVCIDAMHVCHGICRLSHMHAICQELTPVTHESLRILDITYRALRTLVLMRDRREKDK